MKTPSADTDISPCDWWRVRRLRYNVALIAAGILAFIAYVVVGFTLLPREEEFEVTIFSILIQGIGFLLMVGVANVLYFLGPVSEGIVRPHNPERYRHLCFRLGFWFSVLLPLSIPALLAISAMTHQSLSSPNSP